MTDSLLSRTSAKNAPSRKALILDMFNDYLYNQGIISKEERDKVAKHISARCAR